MQPTIKVDLFIVGLEEYLEELEHQIKSPTDQHNSKARTGWASL